MSKDAEVCMGKPTDSLEKRIKLDKVNSAIQNISTKGLELNQSSQAAAELLHRKLIKHKVDEIDIYPNVIGDYGVEALTQAIGENPSITVVRMLGNIKDKHIKALAKAIEKNSHITQIKIWDSKIGEEGIKAFADSIADSKITHLYLSGNNFKDGAMLILSEALVKNSSITHIDLRWNDVTPVGEKYIIEAISKMLNVTEVKLDYYTVELATELKAAIENNKAKAAAPPEENNTSSEPNYISIEETSLNNIQDVEVVFIIGEPAFV